MVEKEQTLKEEQALKPKPACENIWVIWSFPPSPSLMAVANMTHFIVLGSKHDQYIYDGQNANLWKIFLFFFFFFFFTSKVASKMTDRAKLLAFHIWKLLIAVWCG